MIAHTIIMHYYAGYSPPSLFGALSFDMLHFIYNSLKLPFNFSLNFLLCPLMPGEDFLKKIYIDFLAFQHAFYLVLNVSQFSWILLICFMLQMCCILQFSCYPMKIGIFPSNMDATLGSLCSPRVAAERRLQFFLMQLPQNAV